MASQRKPYNHNTKYGRKKIREQAELYRQSLPPEERKEFDSTATIVFLIIALIVLGLLFLTGGGDAVFQYLKR